MSEYIVQHDTMVGIADAIRTMTGTADKLSPDQIATSVTAGNTEVDTQSDLIAQISAALDGKAAGKVVETCTVSLSSGIDTYRPYCYSYITVEDNGNITGAAVSNNANKIVTLSNVVCGSVVSVYWYNEIMSNMLEYATHITGDNRYFNAYQITAPAGGTATIHSNGMISSGGSV